MFKNYYQTVYALDDEAETEIIEAFLDMNGLRYSFYEDTDKNERRMYIYSDDEPGAEEAEKFVKDHISHVSLIKAGERIEEKEYLLKYIDNYQPITVADFRIIPYFHKLPEDSKHIDIHLNPGYSFGTGEHATTQLVLEQMSIMDVSGKSVLDVGTGSGILSIAAEKCGASLAVGFDFDDSTPEAAWDNYNLNSLKNTFFINSYDDGLKRGVIFNIILINMLSREFKPIFKNLADSFSDSDTKFVLSGFLEEEEEEIEKFVKTNSLRIEKRICSREWASYRLSY